MEFTEEENKQLLSIVKLYRSWMFHAMESSGGLEGLTGSDVSSGSDDGVDTASVAYFDQALVVIASIQEKLEGGTVASDHIQLPSVSEARVLVADDDEISVQLISSMLDDTGFQHIDVVSDGLQAYEKITGGEHFDLIICDWRMPKMNGLEVHAKIKEKGLLESSVFVLLTAIDDEILASRAKKQGVKEYLTKPFDADLFDEKLKRFFAL